MQSLFFIFVLIVALLIGAHILYWYKTGKAGPEDDALAFVKIIFSVVRRFYTSFNENINC